MVEGKIGAGSDGQHGFDCPEITAVWMDPEGSELIAGRSANLCDDTGRMEVENQGGIREQTFSFWPLETISSTQALEMYIL